MDVGNFIIEKGHSGCPVKQTLEGNKNESERTVWPANAFNQVRDDQEGGNADGRN